MKKYISNTSGGALIIVLGIMMMLTIAAIMAVHTSQTDMDLSFNQVDHDHAFYLADAGLKRAFVELNKDNIWSTGYAEIEFEDGTYSVAITRPIPVTDPAFKAVYDTVTARSTGVFREARANIRGTVVPELWYPFKYAMYGKEFIIMNNNSQTDSYNSTIAPYDSTTAGTEGDVASDGTISLLNSADIGGDATTSLDSGVTLAVGCSVADTVNTGVDEFNIPAIPDSVFDYYALNNDNLTGITGAYSLIGYDLTLALNNIATLTSGDYYFNNITLESASSLRIASSADTVRIYMRGTLTLYNNASLNPTTEPANCIIYTDGQIVTIGMDTEIRAALYGPDADVELGNSCNWYGSIIANSVDLTNTGYLHYDESLFNQEPQTTGNMFMIAWFEE